MSQAGFTPIQLYFSTTAAATPSAGNLANGELAINITDGRLFYKDNGGVVKLLASNAGSAGDVVGPVSSTDNALVRFDSTTGKLVQNSVGILDDSGNLTGIAALTTSGAVTLNGGTANGVAYLNGSKVLTTGSALVFVDGNNYFGVGVASPTAKIHARQFGAVTARIDRQGDFGPSLELVRDGVAGSASFGLATDNQLGVYLSGSEQMRLTSTGLGIGTSSPAYKLDVSGAIRSVNGYSDNIFMANATSGSVNRFLLGQSLTEGAYIYTDAPAGVATALPLTFWTFGLKRMTLDASGNLGLGVTPSAWDGGFRAVQVGVGAGFVGRNTNTEAWVTSNAVFDQTDGRWEYITTSNASAYTQMAAGQHQWFTAPSGTAGNAISFTQAMTLDASGNLGVGTTSPQQKIQTDGRVRVSTDNINGGDMAVDAGGLAFSSLGATPILFQRNNFANESARIDSSGNFGIGTSSPSSFARMTAAITNSNAYSANSTTWRTFDLQNISSTSGASCGISGVVNGQAVGGIAFVRNGTASDSGSTVLLYGNGSAYAEGARIDSSGNLLVGTTTPVTSARCVFARSSGANIVISSSVLSNGNSAYFSAVNTDTVQRQCDIGVYKHASITNSAGYVGYVEEEGTNQYTWVGNDGNFRISSNPNDIGTNGGTVVGTQTSDERLKNIAGKVQYGLNEILALEPIAFAMKDLPNSKKIGFSAQQVQPIIPEAVYDTGECIDGYDVDAENTMVRTPKSDRTKLSMEYAQIVPVLVKAIQEQQALIQTLTARVAALESN